MQLADIRPLRTAPEWEDLEARGLDLSLGWATIDWIEEYLVAEDGEPMRLTREQANFILAFYARNEHGWVYRRAVLRRAKGWGKSPFIGAICLAELCGPPSELVGIPWVVVAGVSEAQSANTLDAIRAMAEPRAEELGLDIGITRIYCPRNRGKLVPITANAATQEGARPTFAVMDEVHHWTATNGGKKLARVVRRNLAKVRGRSVVTTNAHDPSEDTVARDLFDAHRAQTEGRTKRKDLLYDCLEAPGAVDLADEEQLKLALVCAYGDSYWVDHDALISEIYSPDTPPEDARRFYLNQIVAAADAWVKPWQWDNNHKRDLAPLKRAAHGTWKRGDRVALGFDGGRTDDSSALVCVRISDGAAFLLGLWEKPEGPQGNGWEVDHDKVREAVDEAFATLDVVAFFSDRAEWETDVDNWRDEYAERLKVKATGKHAVAWDMRAHQADTTRGAEGLWRAIIDCEVPHDGDERLARHVHNARRRVGRYGISFGKDGRESPRKVDAVAALLLACMARTAFKGSSSKDGQPGNAVGLAGKRHRLTPAQIAQQQLAVARANRRT